MSGIDIAVVTDWAALDNLADDWRRLAANAPIFQDYDWQSIWRRHFAPHAAPRVVVFSRRGVVIAIAPFVVQRVRWRRLPVRQLTFCANPHSPWGGALATERGRDLALMLWEHLIAHRDWDLARLCGVPEEPSFSSEILNAAEAVGLRHVRSRISTHYVELPSNWETYTATLTRSFNRRLQRTERRLARLGRVSWRIFATSEEIGDGLAHLVEVDADSWRQKRGEVINTNENLRRYYTSLAETYAPRGQCWINALFVDDRALSVLLTFMQGADAFTLKTCYRAHATPNAASPGLWILCQGVREAIARGARRCHFLNAGPAWAQLGGAREGVASQVVYHPSLYGRLLSMQEQAIRRARMVAAGHGVEERV